VERYLGFSREELIGQSILKIYHNPKDREHLLEALSGTGEVVDFEFCAKSKDNRLMFGSVNAHILYNADGEPIGVESMVRDVTERKRTEKHIQTLSHQLLKAHEDERQMISRELHDSVAQDLSTLKIALGIFFDKDSSFQPETKKKFSELSKILDRSISTVRNLSYDLSPPGLKEFGLLQTLATYCEEFEKNTGIHVQFHPAGLKKAIMDPFIQINLYRLIQEGLNNVRKHAEASQVVVKLVGAYPDIILRIEDNGKGFDIQAREQQLDNEKRMGLRSMKERVNLLQGQMTIQSYPMKGTKIWIKFPFKE
jgi:PAS domain S-box-containing protein